MHTHEPAARCAPAAWAALATAGSGASAGAMSRNACARQSAQPATRSARASNRSSNGARTCVGAPRAVMRKYTVDNGDPDAKEGILPVCDSLRTRVRATNVIRSYAPGEIKINDRVFHGPLIVGASTIAPGPADRGAAELTAAHAADIVALEPELVLLGTGSRQIFPAAEFGAQFLRAGIGFEVMDTGAACRTFNVLVGEHRRVVALLLL